MAKKVEFPKADWDKLNEKREEFMKNIFEHDELREALEALAKK